MPQAQLPVVRKSFQYILFTYYWGLLAWIFFSGLILKFMVPEIPEPFGLRWALLVAISLPGIILTFFKKQKRKHFTRLFFWIYTLCTLWASYLAIDFIEWWFYSLQAMAFIAAAGNWLLKFRAYVLYAILILLFSLIFILILEMDRGSLWLFLGTSMIVLLMNMLSVRKRSLEFERIQTLSNLSSNGPIPIFELNRSGMIVFANEEFGHLIGYPKREIVGRKVEEVLQAVDGEEALDFHRSRREGVEVNIYKADKSNLSLRINTSPYGVNGSSYEGLIITANDITGRIEVERQLRERNEQMDLFLYKATHDLKGPLASVKGILNIALQDCHQPEIRDYLQMALTSTDRLDQALIDLLHVTRLNKAELLYEPVNCKELVDDILFSIKHMPESRDVEMKIDIPFREEFNTDKNTLTTILQNLIVNAMKYKRSESYVHKVDISMKRNNGDLEVIVSDNGEGIREEHREKVFIMFYRGNKKSKGTGLGLYIVKQGIEKLRGTVNMTSELGKGTTFVLKIPTAK